MTVRLAIVDDHKVCRVGLRLILERQPDFCVVGEADSAAEAAALIASVRPDVAILDVRLQAQSSLDSLPSFLSSSPGTRFLILSVHDEPQAVRDALDAGAHGFVNKAADPEEIVGGVRSLVSGRSFMSVPLQRHGSFHSAPFRDVNHSTAAPASRAGARPLSEREREILQLFAIGHTHREIADRLGLRLKTVETYRSRLGDKFGVRSRRELVHCAYELGLVTHAPPLVSEGK